MKKLGEKEGRDEKIKKLGKRMDPGWAVFKMRRNKQTVSVY